MNDKYVDKKPEERFKFLKIITIPMKVNSKFKKIENNMTSEVLKFTNNDTAICDLGILT